MTLPPGYLLSTLHFFWTIRDTDTLDRLCSDFGAARYSTNAKTDTTVISGLGPGQRPSPYPGRVHASSLLMALHVVVFALYVGLCIVWAMGLEQRILVAFTSASHVQTWINLISHLIMLLLSIVLVALMQSHATRSPFANLPQPLTSLSDKISSWSGLGSALLNLYHNLSFPTTLGNAILSTTYFATLSGLGISSSFLFTVPAANETISHNVTTLIGSPSVLGMIPPGSNVSGIPSDFTNLTFNWYRSGMGVGVLNSVNTTVFPGLVANRVYDTLLEPWPASSNATATVGFTDFNVKCGSVPGLNASASYSRAQNSQFSDGLSPGTAADDRYPALLSMHYNLGPYAMSVYDVLSVSSSERAVSRLWQPADILLRIPDSSVVPGLGRNIIMYNIYNETGEVSGSQPIRDVQNATGSSESTLVQSLHISEEPGSSSAPPQVGEGAPTASLMIQTIGCSLSTSTGFASLDAATNQLLDLPGAAMGAASHSNWSDWQPDLTNSNALEDTWATMLLPNKGSIGLWDGQPVQPSPLWSCLSYQYDWDTANISTFNTVDLARIYSTCHVPTVVEDYLTTRLFGAVASRDEQGDAVRVSSSADATLSALESALAGLTAMTMWSAARTNTLMVTYAPATRRLSNATGEIALLPSTILAPFNGSTQVVERVLVGRITFNVPALLVGTILAAILAILGVYILASGDAARMRDAPINDAGLLSLMALDNSAVAERLSLSSLDSVKVRRRAGASLVEIVDGRLVPVEKTTS
ncbi:unnamed protein product [Peniophora sp. CBMAI 1063]|nr:unnamed protein product [Peniophora sp. CBMAI 1063]